MATANPPPACFPVCYLFGWLIHHEVRKQRQGGLVHGHRNISRSQLDGAVFASSFLLAKHTIGNEPHPHDPSGRLNQPCIGHFVAFARCPNELLIVRFERALFLVPAPQPQLTGADGDVRLARRPRRNRATEPCLGRQLSTPEVGQVLAIVELNRDAQVVMILQVVFSTLARQDIHVPCLSQAGVVG